MVEAVFEQLDVKQELFGALDKICRAGRGAGDQHLRHPDHPDRGRDRSARSRSSARTSSRPVPMMKLCELVRGYKTSDATLATARAFAEEIGKTCIVVNRDVAGFVTTRLIAALVVEAVKLVESGVVSAEDLDTGLQAGLRPRDGPAGDHRPDRRRRAAARREATSTPTPPTRSSSRRSCWRGWSPPATWAARSGKGFYTYS